MTCLFAPFFFFFFCTDPSTTAKLQDGRAFPGACVIESEAGYGRVHRSASSVANANELEKKRDADTKDFLSNKFGHGL
jgi:hypothetical protein